ncbi:MAG: adenylate/guanylate cyclase domain-containing protein [Leptolyngbyaceae cyanobacterium SM1_4_3]|nr:adenylate/guanylate cyclase domain-containing protein [Leptolyngbyaceae cyanobacterium SM1_4_3]NJN89751.1 adenylate/guanylate cyclase domain-containing protein [Leptolyngbyaceae cyanobacterium SL_5_14]NJO66426.1 adenylate/guanylate cyclase domain-containing protein [Leptolyngbyaceae cyanobacterium RM1_405_57]
MAANTRAEMNRLLQTRNEHPERAAEIDDTIRVAFSQTHAIFVLDMSGFSRLAVRYGIIHFLAMVHRLCVIAQPIIKQHQGKLIKQEADNIFAVFPTVALAVDAAVDLLKTLVAVNTGLPDSLDLFASVGIGYGEVLMVEDSDLYGNEMNLASKLGEDLARAGEILLTEAAFAQVDPAAGRWEKLEFSVSGLQLIAHKRLW